MAMLTKGQTGRDMLKKNMTYWSLKKEPMNRLKGKTT